jgi:hypothetical protein
LLIHDYIWGYLLELVIVSMITRGGNAAMKEGQLVKLRGYGGEELVRRVVRLQNDIVVVCRPEEYESARREGHEPLSVGFHVADIIDENVDRKE